MRTALTYFGESERYKNGYDLARLENRDVSHRLCDSDILNTNKFGLQVRLPILEEHGDDFLEIAVQLVEGCPLGVGTAKSRHEPHEQLGPWATFNYGRKISHDLFQQ